MFRRPGKSMSGVLFGIAPVTVFRHKRCAIRPIVRRVHNPARVSPGVPFS
jgi:hypothetical protein